jgi:hypothetical protein
MVVTTVFTIGSLSPTNRYTERTIDLGASRRKPNAFSVRDVVVESEESDNGYYVSTAMKNKDSATPEPSLLEEVVVALKLDQNPRFMESDRRKSIWDEVSKTISSRMVIRQPRRARACRRKRGFPDGKDGSLAFAVEKTRLAPYVDVLGSNLSGGGGRSYADARNTWSIPTRR